MEKNQNATQQQIAAAAGWAGLSLAELARRVGMSPQNFNNKLNRESLTRSDMERIAAALGCEWRAVFVFPGGKEI